MTSREFLKEVADDAAEDLMRIAKERCAQLDNHDLAKILHAANVLRWVAEDKGIQ